MSRHYENNEEKNQKKFKIYFLKSLFDFGDTLFNFAVCRLRANFLEPTCKRILTHYVFDFF